MASRRAPRPPSARSSRSRGRGRSPRHASALSRPSSPAKRKRPASAASDYETALLMLDKELAGSGHADLLLSPAHSEQSSWGTMSTAAHSWDGGLDDDDDVAGGGGAGRAGSGGDDGGDDDLAPITYEAPPPWLIDELVG
eukprot:PLAT3676.4.p1 GENE.PLAT3676.4~~PLAT3676.4.p1  ORF type:complete len:153 (+),score=47.73 PLAT3676.4:41-460(+)